MPRQTRSDDEAAVIDQRGKSRITGFMLALAVIVFTALANIPYEYAEVDGKWVGTIEFDNMASFHQYQAMPTMAGWPLKYLIQYEFDGEVQRRFFEVSYLVINLTGGIVVALLIYGFIQWRHRRVYQRRATRPVRFLFDAVVALTILTVPGSVVGWEYLESRTHHRLAYRLVPYGNTYLSCWLPKVVVDHVPSGMMPVLRRVRQVHAIRFRGDVAVQESIVRMPTLVGLNVHRDGMNARSLSELKKHFHFAQLQLSDKELTTEHIHEIAQLPWLVDLKLPDTNLNVAMLRQLDHLNLDVVDLRGTEIALSELGKPPWSQTVKELLLTRPRQGESDTLILDGWPRIKTLSVTRYSRRQNHVPLNIELSNLSALETIRLNRLQKHRLVFRHLPRLSTIDEGIGELRYVLAFEDQMPGLTWVSELIMEDTPSVSELGCFARDLASVSLKDIPNLRQFSLGSYLMTVQGENEGQTADATQCQKWIDMLGQWDGPGTVDLSALPLGDADLSPLAANPRIRNLNLDRTGITFEQVQALEGMDQLESLDIRTCRLDDDQLNWLLDRFQQLEQLTVDGAYLRKLDLQSGMRIKILQTTPLQRLEQLRIVDLPSVKTYLRLGSAPREIEIRNAKSLRGLAIEQPWPRDAVVEGLRDLEWFAGGGPAVDDTLMDVLLNCRRLDQLTIAYGSLSRDKLKQIGEFSKLTLLVVPGGDVDDEVTSQWHDLDSLWEVNLNDTTVSADTIGWLSRQKSLRRVSLNRVPLNEAALDALAELTQVSELRLAEVDIPIESLKSLLAAGNLESIDLSGRPIDEELVELLKGRHGLKQVILHGSEVQPRMLEQIVSDNEALYVNLGEIPESLSDELGHELQRRGLSVRANFNRGWQNAFRTVDGFVNPNDRRQLSTPAAEDPRQVVAVPMPISAGRINDEVFRSHQKPATP